MKSRVACVVILMGFLCLSETIRAGEEKHSQRIRDVVYGRRDGLALTMDVFLPPGKPNGVGLILIVSENFQSSPENIVPAFNAEFLKRGYTIFAVVPGSAPRYTVPEMHDDVCRAVRYVRHHAKKYNIDPNRIGGGGASSGGLLGLLLATSPRPANPKVDLVDREDSSIQASANFFPPTDFLNYGAEGKKLIRLQDHPPVSRAAFDFRVFDPKERTFQRITDPIKLTVLYQEISPIYHITEKTPPVFLIHGQKDKLVPIQQSRSFIKKLQKVNNSGELVEKNAEHGWFPIDDDLALMAKWYDKHLSKAR